MAARTEHLFLTQSRIKGGTGGSIAKALVIALSALLSGCSGLFFFPDQNVYITPDRLNLTFDDVYLDTPDGERLHGWWLPANGDDKAKGTVYYLHGNAQNISSHVLNVAWLPERGYNVFLIDYRGFGQSTGSPDIEGVLHDVESGMRWLTAHHTGPYFLLGQSLGGGLGIMLASEWTRRDEQPPLSAVIIDSSFSGFRAIAREKLDSFWLTWPFQVPLSWTIPDEYEGTDHIRNISPVPLLIVHSIRDGIIPFHNGFELYDAASDPKDFLRTDTPHAATFVIPAYRDDAIKFLEGAVSP
ncbi:alpha/beta hydrolase [Marinobacter sp. 1Y8]